MTFYKQPDVELTAEEQLFVEVSLVNEKIPVGFHMAMPRRLDRAITEVDKVFTERELPHKEELLSELRRWQQHVQHGLQFSQRCDQLMQLVLRQLSDACARTRP